MSYNGSGTYVPPAGQPVATGTVIQSATFNTLVTDIGNTFNNVLPRDGQAPMQGQLKVTDGTSSVPGIAFNSEASTGIFRPGTGVLALAASGVENLRINSAGRVLIGTTTDDGINKLQVSGPAKVSGAASLASTLNVTGATTFSSTMNVAGATTLSSVSTSGAATVGTTLNVTGATTLASTLNVTGVSALAGNVGVGTASPVFAAGYAGAQIHSTGTGAQMRLTNPTTSAAATSGLSLAVDVNAGYVWQYSNMPLVFGTNNAERLRIDTSGNLGVGTSTPAVKLHVNGDSLLTGDYAKKAYLGVVGGPFMRGTNDGTNGYFIFDAGAGGAPSPYFSWQYNTTEKMRLDNAGNLSTTGDYFGGTVTASRAASNGAYNNITVAGDALIKGAPATPSLPVTLAVHNGSAIRLSGNTIQMRSANSASDAVVIDSSGNLLVGTSTARGLITSNAPTGGPAISATGKTSTNVAADIEINRAGTITNVGQGATLQFNDSVTPTNSRLIQAGAGNFQFFGYGTGGWAEHARLDINGSLCVGATATNYGTQDVGVFNRSQNDVTRLMVNNQSQGASAQTMLELASYGASWRMYVPSSTNNTNPLIFVGTGAGGGEKMRVTYDGKLLIGRTVDDGSTGLVQVGGSQSIGGRLYVNGATGGYSGYDSGCVVNYAGNGSQFGIALKPASSTADTNAITFLTSGSSYASGSRLGAIQHRAGDACMNLDGSWQYQGYALLNSNQPTINRPTIKGYVEQMQYQSGTTLTIVPDNGTVICFTTSGNTTVTLPAPIDGVTYTLIISYTGAHTVTFTGGNVRWTGGTAPATTSVANKMDKYVFTGVAGYTLGQDGGRNF